MLNIITVIVLIFFNVAFFLFGGNGTGSAAVWISYAFIHFAGICQLATPLLFSDKNATAASVGMSLKMLSLVHFIVILIAGTAIIILSPDGWKVSLLVLLFISLVYLALISSMYMTYRKILRP